MNNFGEMVVFVGNGRLINRLGLLSVVSLISYVAAVIFSPFAYPGYDWKSQAVSDLSAANAPSLTLWTQLISLYGVCGIVSVMMVCVFVHGRLNRSMRVGIYLFAVMCWISGVGYAAFPLSDSAFAGTFQDVMHGYVVTPLTVLFAIAALILIIIGGCRGRQCVPLAIWASVALAAMFAGAIGTGAAPKEVFGVFERFSVFAVAGFNAVLGVFLFLGFERRKPAGGSAV